MRLMIVDDEEFVREVIGDSVEDLFTSIDFAHDGLDAYQKIRSRKPDLIISDISMPNINGPELIQLLKASDFDIPVIWLTGRNTSRIRENADRLGVHQYFEKPFEIEAVRKCILDWKLSVQNRRLERL